MGKAEARRAGRPAGSVERRKTGELGLELGQFLGEERRKEGESDL